MNLTIYEVLFTFIATFHCYSVEATIFPKVGYYLNGYQTSIMAVGKTVVLIRLSR